MSVYRQHQTSAPAEQTIDVQTISAKIVYRHESEVATTRTATLTIKGEINVRDAKPGYDTGHKIRTYTTARDKFDAWLKFGNSIGFLTISRDDDSVMIPHHRIIQIEYKVTENIHVIPSTPLIPDLSGL